MTDGFYCGFRHPKIDHEESLMRPKRRIYDENKLRTQLWQAIFCRQQSIKMVPSSFLFIRLCYTLKKKTIYIHRIPSNTKYSKFIVQLNNNARKLVQIYIKPRSACFIYSISIHESHLNRCLDCRADGRLPPVVFTMRNFALWKDNCSDKRFDNAGFTGWPNLAKQQRLNVLSFSLWWFFRRVSNLDGFLL